MQGFLTSRMARLHSNVAASFLQLGCSRPTEEVNAQIYLRNPDIDIWILRCSGFLRQQPSNQMPCGILKMSVHVLIAVNKCPLSLSLPDMIKTLASFEGADVYGDPEVFSLIGLWGP